MMRIKHYPETKIKSEIADILNRHLGKRSYRAFFFGSRVMGKGSDLSDIDLGIEATRALPYDIVAKIREDLENLPTLYSIDVVDFKTVSPTFRKVALQKTEEIPLESEKL